MVRLSVSYNPTYFYGINTAGGTRFLMSRRRRRDAKRYVGSAGGLNDLFPTDTPTKLAAVTPDCSN